MLLSMDSGDFNNQRTSLSGHQSHNQSSPPIGDSCGNAGRYMSKTSPRDHNLASQPLSSFMSTVSQPSDHQSFGNTMACNNRTREGLILFSSKASDHSKRGRDDSESDGTYSCSTETTVPIALSKRTRDISYIAPRKIPNTFTSAVGSLAVSSMGSGGGTLDRNRRVSFRRQLSGSKVESFLGGDHDAMDVETETRPRSMSF